jgi:hypothetical protein
MFHHPNNFSPSHHSAQKDSTEGSPIEENLDGQTLVSVSTTFYPGSHIDALPPNLIMLSSDSVFFYIHSHVVLTASENGFGVLVPPALSLEKDQMAPVISIPESSVVLNIILHCIYELSCAHYCHSFDDLRIAVNAMPSYGISVKTHIISSNPLFNLLLSHAPLHPLDLYALAASHDLYDVAVSTSPHLLSFSLATLTDEMAARIGPVYLKRLFFLHFGRVDALKRLLLSPPHPHAPTQWCDFAEQKKLTRAWALASAYLAWDARPGADSFRILYVVLETKPSHRPFDERDGVGAESLGGAPHVRPLPTGTEGTH